MIIVIFLDAEHSTRGEFVVVIELVVCLVDETGGLLEWLEVVLGHFDAGEDPRGVLVLVVGVVDPGVGPVTVHPSSDYPSAGLRGSMLLVGDYPVVGVHL